MDDSKPRRKPATYGKPNKRLPFYEFSADSFASSNPGSLATAPATSLARSHQAVSLSQEAGILQNLNGKALSPSPDDSQVSISSPTPVLSDPHADGGAMFDMVSSDDEVQDITISGSKRRKLLPGFNLVGSPKDNSDGELSSRSGRDATKPRPSKSSGKNELRTYRRTKPNAKRPPQVKTERQDDKLLRPEGDSSDSGATTPLSVTSPQQWQSASGSARVSDSSTRSSPAASQRTPKHTRIFSAATSDAGDLTSPGQLALRSLRLTPEKSTKTHTGADHDIAVFATQLTPRRGRQRLVDRLDAPPKQLGPSPSPSRTRDSSEPGNPSQPPSQAQLPSLVHESSFEVRTDNDAESSKTAENATNLRSKAKRSYAQQRSHLSDMALEEIKVSAPSKSVSNQDPLLAQLNSQSTVRSQLELDESDSDEATAGSKIKNIHELRRAGAMNRFEREIETIFEDLDASGAASKSLRLHAFIQLLNKLSRADFASRFLELGLERRLSLITLRELDVINSFFAIHALLILISIENRDQIPPETQDAVTSLALFLLKESRAISNLIKDRKHNLSKALAREISECETLLLSHPIWDDGRPSLLTPQLLALTTLSRMAKRIRTFEQSPANVSSRLIKNIVQILLESSQRLEASSVASDDRLLARAAVSFLENAPQAGPAIAAESIQAQISLGDATNIALRVASVRDIELQQAILRMVVNFSNNDPQVSSSLASRSLMQEVFSIVEKNYISLADNADIGQALDKAKLDSVILALGCLLNFVDSSIEVRQRLLDAGEPPKKAVDWLLQTFGERVEKTSSVSLSPLLVYGISNIVRLQPSTKLKYWLPSDICLCCSATCVLTNAFLHTQSPDYLASHLTSCS